MKQNISDLLKDYREDSLIAEEPTPLSMERIQRRTIESAVPQKKSGLRRIVPVIAVAAVLISLMAVTAIAGDRTLSVSDWFRTALNQQAKKDADFAEAWNLEGDWKDTVGESRLAAIDAHGKLVNQSVTSNGTTITLAAMYGDEYVLNLYFRVTAPEGTVLPDGLDYAFGNGVHLTADGSPQGVVLVPEGYAISENYGLRLVSIPDANPADNQKDFLLSLDHGQYEQRINGILQQQWTFHDAVPKTFAIAGLFYETENASYETILTGDFSFDITNPHGVARSEIEVSGYDYSGHVNWGEGDGGYDYTVQPVRLALSPFSAEIENRFTCTQADRIIHLNFQVVLKDGTTERHWKYVSVDSDSGYSRAVMLFTNPIDLAQIDYILIGDPEFGDGLQKLYP